MPHVYKVTVLIEDFGNSYDEDSVKNVQHYLGQALGSLPKHMKVLDAEMEPVRALVTVKIPL